MVIQALKWDPALSQKVETCQVVMLYDQDRDKAIITALNWGNAIKSTALTRDHHDYVLSNYFGISEGLAVSVVNWPRLALRAEW